MKVKRAVSSYVLLIGILALLATGSLLIYSVYAAMVKSTITKEQRIDIKPLAGILKPNVMSNLEARRRFTMEELAKVQSLDYSDKADNYQQASSSSIVVNKDRNLNESSGSGNINGLKPKEATTSANQ